VYTLPSHGWFLEDFVPLGPENPDVGPGIYAVYTDYETPGDDVDGVYTLVIGRRTEVGSLVPPGQVTVTIPNSLREIVMVADARPESVYEAWVDVWAREDLTRDYRADFEYYAPNGSTRLSIGVLSDV
ncbi:GyrI-like domain-containing protein, partial [Actinomyces naeslundii]